MMRTLNLLHTASAGPSFVYRPKQQKGATRIDLLAEITMISIAQANSLCPPGRSER